MQQFSRQIRAPVARRARHCAAESVVSILMLNNVVTPRRTRIILIKYCSAAYFSQPQVVIRV